MNFAQYLPTSLQRLMPGETGGTPDQLPQDDTMMQLELKRKFALADALKNQAMPQGQMVSDHYVAPSWTQYLANALGKYSGMKGEEAAIKQYGDYSKTQNAKLAELLQPETKLESSYNESGNQPMITETQAMPDKNTFLAKALQARPDLAPKMLEMTLGNMFKEDVPMVVGQGGSVIDKQGNLLYQNPKESALYSNITQDKQGNSFGYNTQTQQFEKIPSNTKMATDSFTAPYMLNGQMVQKNTNTGEIRQAVTQPSQITVGQPIQGVNPATGQPEFVQFGNKPGQEPTFTGIAPPAVKLKEIPPTQKAAYSGNVASIKDIDDAIAAVENSPDEYFGLKGGLGNDLMSRMYPDSVDVRQKITGVRAAKRHELSGSAVTPSENAATAPLLPEPTDSKQTTLTKLRGLRQNYQTLNDSIAGSFGDEYNPLNVSKTPEDKSPLKPKKEYPLKNKQGWILHTDANGNRAYVSSDGQIQEVK